MKYIESLREGERINEIYLCKTKQSALTKAGKPYENVILQDKTGILDAKIWDPGSVGIDDFDSLDYVAVMGDITSFQGNLQLSIKRVRKVQEGEYDPKDYLPVSEKNIDEMYEELCGIIRSVNNPYYKKLLSSFFLEDKEFEKRFKFHSAAKTVHHGFVGGLLEHTLSVTKHCDYFAAYYPMLNRDLIVTAAIFHDIGKLEELSVFPENDYTDEGQLLGHIMIGAEMVGERIRTIEGFPVRIVFSHITESWNMVRRRSRHLQKHWHSVLLIMWMRRWRRFVKFLQMYRRIMWSGRDSTVCSTAISGDPV